MRAIETKDVNQFLNPFYTSSIFPIFLKININRLVDRYYPYHIYTLSEAIKMHLVVPNSLEISLLLAASPRAPYIRFSDIIEVADKNFQR